MHDNNKNKKMIIKGAGKFMAKIPGCDELLTLGTLNNMRFDIQLDMADIEGGDSSVPLDTLLRKKTIDITAEDAKFDLNLVRLVLGSKLREGVSGAAYKIVTETVTLPNPVTLPHTISLTQNAIANGANVVLKGSTAVSATFDYSADEVTITAGVSDGDTVTISYAIPTTFDKDGYVWELEEKHTVENGKIQLAFGATLFGQTAAEKAEHISVRSIKSNKLLKQVTGTPAEHEYKVDTSTGEISFNAHLEKVDVYVNYKRTEVVDVLDITTKDFPLTVSIVHDGRFEQKDGTIQGFQTELFSCRVKSNFTIDAARQQASTHSVTLTVIDPERPDNKLGTIKRYEIENQNTTDVC